MSTKFEVRNFVKLPQTIESKITKQLTHLLPIFAQRTESKLHHY